MPMTLRQERILRFCNYKGKGLEIGASFNPIAPKKEGFDIDVMDYLSREELIEKYRDQDTTPNYLENLIEKVDFVWNGQPYVDLVDKKYDYILSSHLIEHMPDIVTHINDCYNILKDNGVYSIVVPDKRYCFDVLRKETTLEDVLQRIGNKQYTEEMITNYVDEIVQNNRVISWDKMTTLFQYEPIYDDKYKKKVHDNPHIFNIDIHVSVFTPLSFEKLMNQLYDLKIIKMPLVYIDCDTECGEFFAVFQKTDGKEKFCYPSPIEKVKLKKAFHVDKIYTENGRVITQGFASINGMPPEEITVYIGNRKIETVRIMRPDINADINYNKYGFLSNFPLSQLKKGVNLIRVRATNKNGSTDYWVPNLFWVTKRKIIDLKTKLNLDYSRQIRESG